MKPRFLGVLFILVCAACAPAGGQPKFNLPVLPSATSVPMTAGARLVATLPQRIRVIGPADPAAARALPLRVVERFTDRQGMFGLDELDGVCPDWRERGTWA